MKRTGFVFGNRQPFGNFCVAFFPEGEQDGEEEEEECANAGDTTNGGPKDKSTR